MCRGAEFLSWDVCAYAKASVSVQVALQSMLPRQLLFRSSWVFRRGHRCHCCASRIWVWGRVALCGGAHPPLLLLDHARGASHGCAGGGSDHGKLPPTCGTSSTRGIVRSFMTRCSLLEEAQSTRAAMPNGSWMNGPGLLSGDAAGVRSRAELGTQPGACCFLFSFSPPALHTRPIRIRACVVSSVARVGLVLSCLYQEEGAFRLSCAAPRGSNSVATRFWSFGYQLQC